MVVAIPEIIPVELSNSIAEGKLGYISQLVMSPPEVIGIKGAILSLTVTFNSLNGYKMTIIESLLVSKLSQMPSPSASLG